MTGEMTLRGRILPIGGLREKTFAAARAGIKHIILPKANAVDIDEVDIAVRNQLEFHFVSNFDEIVPIIFRESSETIAANSFDIASTT